MSSTASGPTEWSASEQVRRTMFRVLAVLRIVVFVYAVVVNTGRADEMARPQLMWAALVAMGVWTLVANLVYELARPRPMWFFVLDVAVSCGFFALSPVTHGEDMWSRGGQSLPTLWVFGAVLAVAIGYGWWQGLVAALVVSVVDLTVRVYINSNTWANIFLLVLASVAVGFMSRALCRASEARAKADRLQATLEERARLSRAVHDGVLQALAMVQRRAQERDDLADLGRLAAEQESSLRALVQYDARTTATAASGAQGGAGLVDLVHALEPVVGSRSLSGPGGPVLLSAGVVGELSAAVSECLLNVSRHVGEDAPAWVLVEELAEDVVVTVRDEGPGIPDDRLTTATAEGRLGVSGSIVGRLRDLGGRAELITGPTIGTEWELHVPRTATAQEGGPR